MIEQQDHRISRVEQDGSGGFTGLARNSGDLCAGSSASLWLLLGYGRDAKAANGGDGELV
jgi:hypothetical protein